MITLPSERAIASARAHWRASLSDRERSQRAGWEIVSARSDRDRERSERSEPASDRTKVMVFGMIGDWDQPASDFVSALDQIASAHIDLHVNSPGGFVYDGVAMYEALSAHPARVTAHIDGLAASAASFLVQSADEIAIAGAGRMMIHDAQGLAVGSPADMREMADLLEAVSNDIAGIYAARAGGRPATWRAAMTAETWYSSDQAVEAKLADRVMKKDKKTPAPDNRTRLIQARLRAARTLEGVK